MNKYGIAIPAEITDKRERKKWYHKQYSALFEYDHPDRHKTEKRYKKARQIAKLWYQKNKDRNRIRSRKWLKNNPERAKYNLVKWRNKNPHKPVQYTANYRARKRKRVGNLKLVNSFIESVRNRRFVDCYYCGKTVYGKSCHIEHIHEMSRGGNHSVENLAVSCASCNHQKHNKLLSEWKREGQQFLNL